MSVRNCAEVGKILQETISRLMANDRLCRLLYFTDRDPFGSLAEKFGLIKENMTEKEKEAAEKEALSMWGQIKSKEIYEKLIKIIPRVGAKEYDNSLLVVRVARGSKNMGNNEFLDLAIYIESFVPLTQWAIDDENLRPFLILGEIQKSLDGKRMNQIGKMTGGDFELQVLTEEISCYEQGFVITSYD